MATQPQSSPTTQTAVATMQAITRDAYGGPEVLGLETIDRPVPEDHHVLVKIHAASINPMEWHMMTGTPFLARLTQGLRRPKSRMLGADFAGVVEEVGTEVTEFEPGDEVFGESWGTYGEYVRMSADKLTTKPENVTFVQAGSVSIAAFTALQGLRDKGQIQPGDEVLINGASGGVGTFAVQMAKHLGAVVTGVCSSRNVPMVRDLGANHVVDYQSTDITTAGKRFDVILDTAGGWSLRQIGGMLKDEGVFVSIGSEVKTSPKLLWGMFTMIVRSWFGKKKYRSMLARFNHDDLLIIREMLASGAVTPVIDETFQLAEVPEAMRRQGEGHARGKKVITVVADEGTAR